MGIRGRSIIAGLLIAGLVGISAGSAASTQWNPWGPWSLFKTTQKITFKSTPPSPAVIGGTYTPTASGGRSGNPVTFSIDASAKEICSISGATVTFVALGTCVIDANQAGSASYEGAAQVQQSFPVLGAQSITFTSAPPKPAVIGGTYPVTASGGGSGNPVTFSIDASAKGSCSISGATVTFVAVGTCVIDANQAGNANYDAATQVQQSFVVVGTQSITFTSAPPSPAVIGGTYIPTASGGASGNPVTFSIDPSANGSCSISGATVTFVAVGTCVIDANQAGNTNYEAATQVQQSFDPDTGTQNITFTSTPPSPAVVGGTYTPAASGGASGNPVTFSVDPSANGSCSISGATVTFVAVGTCVIDANQAGNANYDTATQVQQSFDLGPGIQTITFTSTPPSPAILGGTYAVTATGGASGNPVTFSIDPSANGSCSISGATVTFVAVGTCVIDANQAGNSNYEAASQVQQSFDPDSDTQNITFTSTPPNPAVIGGTYPVTASGGASGNPVTFSIDPSANGSCSISGATVTFVAVGTCVIDANQAGNANYEAALQVQQSFPVLGTQSITFTSTPPKPAVIGGTYPVTAGGGASGNPVTFSIDPSAKGSCSLSGATVTFVAVGTCIIDANQAGNANYEAALQIQQSFAVLGTQSIHFTSTPPGSAVVGGTYPVTASGGASGNPVTFSIDPSANGSCSISGATVTFVAVGTCVIDANQAGNANYEAATQVQQSFAILGTQVISFTSTPPGSAVVGGTYPVTAGGGASGNPVTFSIDPSANGSCSISGATVTFVAVGNCVIDANQAGNASYEAATQVQQSFAVVASGSPTISPNSSQSATVASYTNGVAGTTDATITFTGPVPSSWVAASGLVAGSAVVDTTNPTVIADQSGGPGQPLGPTIASISGDTISLEQVVLNGSAAITGFTPAAITMTSANIGDVIRAATCTAYGADDGCPTYFMTAGSAGMISDGNLTWDNPAYFVGQDASPSGIPSLSGHGGVGGGDDVTMAANNSEDATWTADIAGGQYNGINAFSNEGTYAYSGIVDDYTSLTQTYAQHMPCCVLSKEAGMYGANSNFWGWNMTEDYFTQPGGAKGADQEELSIQNSYSNTGTVGTLTQNQYPNSFTAASGTSGTDTITSTSMLGSVTTGSLVQDVTHPSYIPSGTSVSAVTSTTGITLSANLNDTITGDTIDIASGWNYGVTANDIQVGDAYPTPATTTGTSGSNYLNVSLADFTNPATDMGLVTQGESISDSLGYIPANTYIGAVNQSSSTDSLTLVNSSGSPADLTGNIGSGDTITIPLEWFLQDGAQNHNADGTCSNGYPNCGQLVLHAGCDWSDIADVPNPSGTIPTKGIVSWLETHAAPQSTGLVSSKMTGTDTWGNAPDPCMNPESGTNGQASGPWFTGSTSIVQDPVVGSGSDTGPWADYGYIVPGSSVSELGQGWEVLGTSSTRQTYSLSQFMISATGGKAS
jgi:hypothetical protein